ncbi:hypothetical protein NKR19_g676 [Coniochaeta hoffmannii]|uniref:Uncharacterized protein n=1 Tax=Coniochaeta hoffmannii TaxID=91930 RepID=A0AA38SE33_9PEZI|nr:hypothetical protein NKR19_g676 [Coniochaeta hoffmannii]
MRAASVAGLVLASLIKLANAEDLLFYNDMLYNEYKEATTTLGYTAHIASDAEWRGYTTADFAKYKALIIPDPNCGTIDRIKFLEDTKAVWSPAVTGNVILIGTDPTYHSASRAGAIDLIDNSIRFAASDPKGTGLYFSLSCYYDSGDITTIESLSEFGTFYVRGKLACYNDAHLVADAPELKSLDDDSIGNWSCSVHEVFTEFPRMGMEPGTDGFEAFAIARNATGDGEESYADGSSGIPYIIARGATPVGCGDGKIEDSFGEECDNGKDGNGHCSSQHVCQLHIPEFNITRNHNGSFINDPTGPPPPPNSVTASAGSPGSSNPSSPVSEPTAPGTPPPITIVTTIDGPTPSIITVIATADPPLSAEFGSGPPPPITIVTTIGGPVPSVITIIANPPAETNPVPMPPPSGPGASTGAHPSSTTAGISSGSGPATSSDVSYLSALHSGSSAFEAPDASSSAGAGSAVPATTVTSGSLVAPNPGPSTATTGGAGTDAPAGSGTSSSGGLSGSTSAISTSSSGSASASSSNSAISTTYTATSSDGPGISKNGTTFTGLTNSASGTVLPTTLATTTLPSGPGSTCDAYIGIEVIEFIEITEICPEDATITETITTCLSTMTRPICHTSTPGYPCYPCMGLTPSAGDTATVTRSSCTSSTPVTTTITAQTCHTCEAATYTTTSLPGHTPGGPCKDCVPYTSGPLTLPTTTVTLDATATAPVRISQPSCHDCPDAAPTVQPNAPVGSAPAVPGTSAIGGGGGGGGGAGASPTPTKAAPGTVVPGNPAPPNTSDAAGGYGPGAGEPAAPTTTASSPATVPSKSAVPSYVTAAGGPRRVAWELGGGVVAAVVWALMMV